jgi:hypothetical protein
MRPAILSYAVWSALMSATPLCLVNIFSHIVAKPFPSITKAPRTTSGIHPVPARRRLRCHPGRSRAPLRERFVVTLLHSLDKRYTLVTLLFLATLFIHCCYTVVALLLHCRYTLLTLLLQVSSPSRTSLSGTRGPLHKSQNTWLVCSDWA